MIDKPPRGGLADHSRGLCSPCGDNAPPESTATALTPVPRRRPRGAPWLLPLDEPPDLWYHQDEMAHYLKPVLTTLAVVALLALTLTGCTARWSGSVSLEVDRPHSHTEAGP